MSFWTDGLVANALRDYLARSDDARLAKLLDEEKPATMPAPAREEHTALPKRERPRPYPLRPRKVAA